jgi:hypothetical protein
MERFEQEESQRSYLSDDDLNKKHQHKGVVFDNLRDAREYQNKYKKENKGKDCFIYPIKDAVFEVDLIEGSKRKPKNYQNIIDYKIVGYLVSTPEEVIKKWR